MLGLAFGTWVRISIGVTLIAALVWSHTAAYRAGRSIEQADFAQKIIQENEDAAEASEEWRARYRMCLASGKLYDFETGTCDD